MASRSTRQRIKDQGLYIIVECKRIQSHLKNIQDFSRGESPYITSNIPSLVTMTDEVQRTFEKFRKGF